MTQVCLSRIQADILYTFIQDHLSEENVYKTALQKIMDKIKNTKWED